MVGRFVTILSSFLVLTILAGCGSSKKNLLTFINKKQKKTQMEWAKQCGPIADHNLPGEGDGVCWTTYQRLSRKTGKSTLFVAVRMDQNLTSQVIVFGVPRGVNTERGIRLKFDDEIPAKLDFSHCDGNGCYAKMPMSKNTLIKLKYSKRMVVAVMSKYSDKAYGTNVPLYRFVFAYNSDKPTTGNLKTASR